MKILSEIKRLAAFPGTIICYSLMGWVLFVGFIRLVKWVWCNS